MDRRAFLQAAMLASATASFAAKAQQAGKVWRIGYLSVSAPESDGSWLAAFERGLRDFGYVEGRNVVIERRHAGGSLERLAELAGELVRLKMDVVVTFGGVDEVKKASSTIPIVMTVHADPVGAGIVANLARPGGQVTGLSDLHGSLAPKRLELLKEVVPSVSRVAVLFSPAATTTAAGLQVKDLQAAAPAFAVTVLPLAVRGADDIDRAFTTMRQERAGGLVVVADYK
ncbi:MAG: ABC transporter substrate-binding protein, partial [Dongiaceae bacterium]